MKLNDYPIQKFIKAVLSGKPGRRKSSAGLTFPQPMLIFDFDGKLEGPILWARKMGIKLDGIEVKGPKDFDYDWSKFDRELRAQVKKPFFATYGFDSITSIGDSLLGFTAESKERADPAKVKKVGGVQVAGIDEYNAESSGIMDILLFAKDVPANVWITAHILEVKNVDLESKGVTISRSILTGGKKLAPKIPIYMNENYRFEIEASIKVGDGDKTVCYTQANSEDDYARTAFPLPSKFEFTGRLFYDVLMEKIKQGIG